MGNKNIIWILIFAGVLFLNNIPQKATADTYTYYALNAQPFVATREYYKGIGYHCVSAGVGVTCTKTESYAYIGSYGSNQDDYRTLTGYASYATGAYLATVRIDMVNSPFLYLQNPPTGDISVGLNSQLNKYYPKPVFNQDNGWSVKAKDNKISINDEEKEHLFYELEISKINLNRSGKNFSSKEELTDYLQNSDFLTKLGFSEIEKKNSLGYFLPKLTETEDKNFYYLTILSDKAVAEISSLNIKPEPEEIIRQYFAVYPTAVPVKTEGEFIFPEHKSTNLDDFTAKETGEFLIQEPMQVFFE